MQRFDRPNGQGDVMPNAQLDGGDLPETVFVQYNTDDPDDCFLMANSSIEGAAENAECCEAFKKVVGEYKLVRKFTTRRDVEVVCEPVE
jgi:hypothetical protein